MKSYEHGGDIYSNEAEMDFSANINPLGLPQSVRNAAVAAVDSCIHYPDSRCGALRQSLAVKLQLKKEDVLCGNGAADLIFQLVWALRPEIGLVTAPSFLEYEQALRSFGSQVLLFDLREEEAFVLDPQKLLSFLQHKEKENIRPGLLFLCNPNNPTGLGVKTLLWQPLLDYCEEKGIIVAADQCFSEFLEDENSYSLTGFLREGRYKNLVIFQAFTKIYAMAGLRLGYCLCRNHGLLEQMEGVRQPWTVSAPAQAAGLAALGEKEFVKATRTLISGEREYLKEGLMRLGFTVWPSLANYIFFRDEKGDKREAWLYNSCLKKGVLIRSCSNYRGLDSRYYRICVKTREENQRFLKILEEITEEREEKWQRQL